jgi:nicotinate-nucleotide pyrophosphorylase (carboxylating)
VIPTSLLDELIDRALSEDAFEADVTTAATVDEAALSVGHAVAKSPLVVAGGDVFLRVFSRVDPEVRAERALQDGSRAAPGDVLWRVHGRTRSLLGGERTALNFAQRLSGIATLTADYVSRIPEGSALRVTDTRKTTPGLRALERAAVRAGGGHNHRSDLSAAVLIKDNHVAAVGGVSEALRRARRAAPHTSRVEVEVESLGELDEALAGGADIVLLDNFPAADVAGAVARVGGRALVEVSGGVTPERIPELARAGVDIVSVGALTHSPRAADISFEIEPER